MTNPYAYPSQPWIPTLLAARFDVQLDGTALPWRFPPQQRDALNERTDFVSRTIDRSKRVQATLIRRVDPLRSEVMFELAVAILPGDYGLSRREPAEIRLAISDVAVRLWDMARRPEMVQYLNGADGSSRVVLVTLRGSDAEDLLAGQSVAIGGVVYRDENESRLRTDWADWVTINSMPHSLICRADSRSEHTRMLAVEQSKLMFPDITHRAIFGMLESPGATGDQNDLAWIPHLDQIENEIRQSVWNEGCRPTHFYDNDGLPLLADPVARPLWNGRPRGNDESGSRSLSGMAWRGHDRQHYCPYTLIALAERCDDPLVHLELDHQVETWIGNHTVVSNTPVDSLDSPRAVGRGMAAGVKLWLARPIDRLRDAILARADKVHATLVQHMKSSVGVMQYRSLGDSFSLFQEWSEIDFRGDVDVQIGVRPSVGPSTIPLGPILEVRGPDPRALNVDHWRPWEEAQAAIGMAMVARVFGRPKDHWSSAVLALNVMLNGYRDDGQIAFAMAWPTPPKADLQPGVNVVWADGTEFRVWCRAALQWVEWLTARPELLDHLHAGGIPGPFVDAAYQIGESILNERAKALLALTPAPTDPVQLAAYQRWLIDWNNAMVGA